MQIEKATEIADEIIAMYAKHGGEEYAGEQVSQLEHMLQAAQLAQAEGYGDEIILAAFLHDIGHICVSAQPGNDMDGFGIKNHEDMGAEFLKARGFSKKLIRLVESHVEAKRYLTYKFPEYYNQLSQASKKTLQYQGGPMPEEEAAAFEQYPLFKLIIKMRRWDDEAKLVGLPLPELSHYKKMIINHLQKQQQFSVL